MLLTSSIDEKATKITDDFLQALYSSRENIRLCIALTVTFMCYDILTIQDSTRYLQDITKAYEDGGINSDTKVFTTYTAFYWKEDSVNDADNVLARHDETVGQKYIFLIYIFTTF